MASVTASDSPSQQQREPSDWELLRRSADDPEEFGHFYERHVDYVLAYLYRRTACVETAADLTAETFAAAFLARRRFKDRGAPARAWLLGIARHKLSKTLRRARVERKARNRLRLEPIAVDELSYERIEALAGMEALRGELREAIQSLSPALAQAVYLRVAMDLSYPDVASRLGCSEAAARVRVMRGLTELSIAMGVN